MSRSSETAWADFWKGGGAGPESGCLPSGLRQIDAAQRSLWQDVARPLPAKAAILDLATGDGAVLGKIRQVRGDLELVGVDSSPVLPPGPKGVRLMTGVAMESLPFPPSSFDLVTSQFGFEYGDTGKIAAEVHRILRPGASFAFVIHHSSGAIVAHNRGRSEALRWSAVESGLLDKAVALARARATIALPTPPFFHQAPMEAQRRFPDQCVAEEFATAVLHTLEMGRRHPASETLEVLATLRAKVENEIARITALRNAARDLRQITQLRRDLGTASLRGPAPVELYPDAESVPFGWLILGSRLGDG